MQGPIAHARHGGLADLSAHNIGNPEHYAGGGIVAFDDGGEIKHYAVGQQVIRGPNASVAPITAAGAMNQNLTGYDMFGNPQGTLDQYNVSSQPQSDQDFSLMGLPNPVGTAEATATPSNNTLQPPPKESDTDFLQRMAQVHADPKPTVIDEKGDDVQTRIARSEEMGHPPLGPTFDKKLRDILMRDLEPGEAITPEKYAAAFKELEASEGIGEAYNRVQDIVTKNHERNAQNYSGLMGLAGGEAGAAIVRKASLRGGDPGYAGTGMSGFLASLGEGIGSLTAAKRDAMHQYQTAEQATDKMDIDSAMNEEARKSQNLRSAYGYTREDLKDHAALQGRALQGLVTMRDIDTRMAEVNESRYGNDLYRFGVLNQRADQFGQTMGFRHQQLLSGTNNEAMAYRTFNRLRANRIAGQQVDSQAYARAKQLALGQGVEPALLGDTPDGLNSGMGGMGSLPPGVRVTPYGE